MNSCLFSFLIAAFVGSILAQSILSVYVHPLSLNEFLDWCLHRATTPIVAKGSDVVVYHAWNGFWLILLLLPSLASVGGLLYSRFERSKNSVLWMAAVVLSGLLFVFQIHWVSSPFGNVREPQNYANDVNTYLDYGQNAHARARLEYAVQHGAKIDGLYYFIRGRVRQATHEYTGALDDYTQAMKLSEKDLSGPSGQERAERATCYLDMNEYDKALADARCALLQTQIHRKKRYKWDAGTYNNIDRDAWDTIGLAHFHRKEYAQAIDAFEAAAKLCPNAGYEHYGKARCFERLGKRDEAATEVAMLRKLKWEPDDKLVAILK